MRLAVVNLKGGTGKTTSATALAMSLSLRGRTLLIDADPQGSALAWSEEASFPFPTIGLPVRDLQVRLLQLGADYNHVVIDTPPGVPPIVRSAVLAADTVLIPLSPSGVELRQIGPTFELLAELEPHSPVLRVLLTQVHPRTVASRVAREILEKADVPLLHNEVPHRQGYRTAFGDLIAPNHYESVLAELLEAA
jgi:chromosome partitioning protein